MILVMQPVRKVQENLVFQKVVSLKLNETGRKCFIFIAYSSNSSHMAVRLSALRVCRPSPPGRFLVLIPVRG
jgi:hypothetical protein